MKNKPLFNQIQLDLEEELPLSCESAESEEALRKDIAVIGLAGKLPDARNAREYWTNITLGRDSIRQIPVSRKQDYEEVMSALLKKDCQKDQAEYAESGYLDRVDGFDCEYFSISPKEAKLMDPNQRLFLQCCVEAMEDAGYGKGRLGGSPTGVFLGYSSDFGGEYKHLLSGESAELADLAMTGNIKSIIPARLAYWLDVHGPSLLVDTACSSSLVAVHLACQSIRRGECGMAFAGGVKVQLQPFDKSSTGIGIVSSGFRTRTFDQDADGTGLGEGAGVVLLKDAKQAIQDGDHIYALIKGSAINQDGQSIGITAPNSKAQEELIIRAWKDADVHPETISLIEAHGTATRLGDPVEIDGITRAFDRYTRKKQFCAIGSIKTNIGHLDHAAGISGLLKCILALQHETLPPTIHFQSPNPNISFHDSPVYVNDAVRSWESGDHPRRCGINSFGLSGTNCHMILEQYKEPAALERAGKRSADRWNIMALSAKNSDVLRRLVSEYHQFINQSEAIDLDNLCYTANTGRDHYAHKAAIVFRNRMDLLEKLQSLKQAGIEKSSMEQVYVRPGHEHANANIPVSCPDVQGIVQEMRAAADQHRVPLLQQLAQLYVQGEAIPWQSLYAHGRYQLISLPAYPFQETRCWIEPKAYMTKTGPLVDQCLVRSNGVEVYEARFSCDTHWVVAEHKIVDYYVLPGTAYLEIVAQILKQTVSEQGGLMMENFMFLQPLQMKEHEEKSVHIVLTRQKSGIDVMITSLSGELPDEWVIHCKGKVSILHGEKPNRRVALPDILQESKRQSVAGYKPGAEAPVQTGPHWECMKEIYVEPDRIVAYFELPAPFAAEVHAYTMHPSMLDCAVNIPISQIRDGLFLPFTYKRIRFYGNMPNRFYSMLQMKNNQTAELQETASFDIVLFDEAGEVFAEIEEYSLKRVHIESSSSAPVLPGGLFHRLQWERQPLRELEQAEGNIPLTLVFAGQDPLSHRLLAALQERDMPFISVVMGECFNKKDDHHYRISGNQQDFDRLCGEIQTRGVQRILHCFSWNHASSLPGSDVEQEMNKGLFSLFYLTKSLVAHNIREKIELVLMADLAYQVTLNEPWLNPMHSAFYHLGKVVSSEYANLRCRCIDLDPETEVTALLAELDNLPDHYVTAYRKGERYGQRMMELPLSNPVPQELILSSSGCYLITGGTGGLGLTTAAHLAHKKPVNLVLVSRSGFPGEAEWEEILQKGEEHEVIRRIKILQQIKENGSTYTFYRADISRRTDLENVLQDVRSRFGSINGIVHAAGVAGDQFLFNREEQRFREVVESKIAGSIYLAELITEPLEFFVCYSSVSSLEGTPGQGDYVAANGFLDSFVYTLPANQNGITLNWAPWAEIGMAYDYGTFKQELIFNLLPTRVAMSAFDAALASGEKQVVIGTINKENAAKNFRSSFFYEGNNLLMNYVKPQLVVQANPPAQASAALAEGRTYNGSPQAIKELIRQLWVTLLESESIGLDDAFTSIGGNSIFAVYLLQELEKAFPGMLGISDIFTYPTINKMAEYVYSRMEQDQPSSSAKANPSQEDEDHDLDQILHRLANGELDIDEVERLLGEDE
ncbi:SDR family NAD(P)-dependent oxidoreductase [Paenibacillus jilunlii]|uniref:Polyketide synthase PksM/polyketide synthase PksN n=1 Tax=Paenibacillus jilunlii TaxID=682956 RepID=A0A1G9Y0H7_9BACL|nr:SDR family NAD(P)-dependent oxidoreductase [Paenibacillus jilunlii]SDN02574.1 polyketide synthase PksM/polyketide synthase PksN [Paenibacillus jilunlii]